MHLIYAKWRLIGAIIGGLKVLAIALLSIAPGSDFMNWVSGAKGVLVSLSAGHVTTLPNFGAYLGIEVILAPFFWVWTILPIEHPPLTAIVQHAPPAIYLALLMKTPIFLSDTLVGILLSRLVRNAAGSGRQCVIAFFTWYANPYNIYWLYGYGAMDVIPAAFVLFALMLGVSHKWARSALATTIGGLLRIYPFFVLPFLLHLTRTKNARLRLISGSMFPLVSLILLAYATTSNTIANSLMIPLNQLWLFDFLGGREHSWTTAGGQILILTPVLILSQFYVVLRFWKADSNIIHLAAVSLLTLLLGGTIYAGSSQHFIWISPLLSASVALQPEETWVFGSTFVAAYLSPAAYPFTLPMFTPARLVVDNFLAGAFFSMKTIYLLRLNLSNISLAALTKSPSTFAQEL